VVVYSCASITLPLLAQYVLVRNEPRPAKRLFPQLGALTAEFREATENNPKFQASLELARKHYK